MCGIVLMGCKYPGLRDVEIFEELLYADTFRGPHSTGVHSLFHLADKEPVITETQKKMLDGPSFLTSDFWPLVSEKRTPGTTANSVFIKRPFCMIGHNRWATKGGINDTNAHPFTHGHITMVHNGTLRNQALLPEHAKFEVDSDNVAYSLSTWGVDKTIQNLNGAFTLVWHDANDQTVNIIRNSERPFHLARTSAGDWFGASEAAMLKWILGRQKTPVTIAESFECEVGVQYIFDVSTGKFVHKENRKHELPTFRAYSYFQGRTTVGASSSWEDTDYDAWWDDRRAHNYPEASRTQTPSSVIAESELGTGAMNAMLWDNGVNERIGDWITFTANDFKSYPKNSKFGVLEGYLNTKGYSGVVCNGIEQSIYTQYAEYRGKILKSYMDSGTMYVVVSQVAKIKKSGNVVAVEKKERNVGDTFSFKVDSIDTLRRSWVGFAEDGTEVYGDLLYGMKLDDVWEGKSCVKLDGRHRMAALRLTQPISSGEFKEGDLVKFKISSVNLGIGTFDGIGENGVRVSGSVPKEVFLNVHEVWEGVVSIKYLNSSYRVKDLRKPGMKAEISIIDQVLAETAEEVEEVLDDTVYKTTATGDRFTAKKWKDSLVSDCCACCSPISFDEIETAVIISGYSCCKECNDKEPPFDTGNPRQPLASDMDYFTCTECNQRKHNANRIGTATVCNVCEGRRSRLNRKVLSLPSTASDVGKVIEFTLTQLSVGPAFWGKTRTDLAVSGVIPEGMGVEIGETLIGKISNKHVDGSYRLTDIKKKGNRGAVIYQIRQAKVLSNGVTVKRDIWEAVMGKCKTCTKQIPWEKADLTTLVGGVPVCEDCIQLVV